MKQLIAFGMALVLLFAAGTPAYTQEDATRPEAEPFVASAETDIDPIAGQLQRNEIAILNLDGAVAARRLCRTTCVHRQWRTVFRPGDGSDGCALWEREESRCLEKQRAWPRCTCVYTDWYAPSETCVESV